MAATKGPAKKVQPSIKYKCNSAEENKKPSKIDNHVCEEYAYAFKKQNSKREETKLSQILKTDVLISAVDLMWDQSDYLSGNSISSLKEEILDDLHREKLCKSQVSADAKRFHVDPKAMVQLSPAPQPNLKFLKVTEKMSIFNQDSQNYARSSSQWFMQTSDATIVNGYGKENGFGLEISCGTEKLYSWMKQLVPTSIRCHMKRAEVEKKEMFYDRIRNADNSKAECTSGNRYSSARNFPMADAVCHSTSVESRSPLAGHKVCLDTRISTSLDVDYLLAPDKDISCDNSGTSTMSSRLCTDCHNEISSSRNDAQEDRGDLADDKELLENERKDAEMEISLSSTEIPKYALAKQWHACAGALAGISVSLCLHPLDTVKTIIQSCRLEKRSLCYIGRSVISERGFSGLYRGIASNIASSAPISALYTFTYESVKGALLPLFPKEYRSFTHCIAGGCASIATSFIFTPSERIKQQMQVSSHYRNCWCALVGIIQKGGLPSLYAGWVAVLCRNIPHSIIKFYAYESLKQIMLSPLDPGAQPNTSQTLICGGLAGSAAAFFTTPFDVVKTRLQTQIPGARNQSSNVLQALRAIRKQEGLRGLYRGLIPRLVMYMSQGAIFFASYEFYKSLLSLEEVPQPSSSAIWQRPTDKDGSPSIEHSRLQHVHS